MLKTLDMSSSPYAAMSCRLGLSCRIGNRNSYLSAERIRQS